MNFKRWLVAGVFCCLTSVGAEAADWPAFRGPKGDGISSEKSAPIEWSRRDNIKWEAALPQKGNSSPIVSNGRVFVTCAEDTEGKHRSLFCFDRKDGSLLWKKTVELDAKEATHNTNPYCASTPLADGKRVVVWHGTPGIFCYDFEGNEIWKQKLGTSRHMWGYASSPIFYKDKVILSFGPGVETFMTALDRATGQVLWKTPEPGGSNAREHGLVASFSTPVIAKVDGQDQLICSMPTRVVAYSPDAGDILWTLEGLAGSKGKLVYTSPVVSGKLGAALGGYNGPGVGFRLGGSGDVTAKNRLWRNEKSQPQRIGSGVILGNYIYQANAGPSTIECIELDTGKTVWKSRTPDGQSCWGSIVSAGGQLYVTTRGGTTVVFRPTPEKFDLVAANKMGESSNATPAVSDGEIFLRTDKGLYCVSN
jgi:outer membrane protein assembly factor BamB